MWKFSVCCVLLLVAYVVGDGHIKPCFEDQEACNEHLREMLLAKDKFWFGEKYKAHCNSTKPEHGCENPDTEKQSIVERFYRDLKTDTQLKDMVSKMSFLDVTFSSLEHKYFACGHEFHTPGLKDHKIDPLHVTPACQSSLKFTPEVRWWNFDPNKKYTVMIWDAGWSYLHGLYINVHGGMMSTGDVIQPYQGPSSSAPYANPYLFIVMPQNQTLDVMQVAIMYGQYMQSSGAMDEWRFRPSTFMTMVSGYLQDPVAANVMLITGDAYGAQKNKDYGIYDSCPHIASGMGHLHTAMKRAELHGEWMEMEGKNTSMLASLEIVVEPIFHTDDLAFESCCNKFSYLRSHLIPNPFSHRPERPVKVRSPPRIRVAPMDLTNQMFGMAGKVYTMMLVDFGSIHSPPKEGNAYRLHCLVINIMGKDLMSGEEIIPYMTPIPHERDGPRMMTFLLFQQKARIAMTPDLREYAHGMCSNVKTDMCLYDVKRMVMDWGLGHVKGMNSFLIEQDDYARQVIYRQWQKMPESDVCMGVPGYSNPCPMALYPDPIKASSAVSREPLAALLAAALLTVLLNH